MDRIIDGPVNPVNPVKNSLNRFGDQGDFLNADRIDRTGGDAGAAADTVILIDPDHVDLVLLLRDFPVQGHAGHAC